jgi:hypothetical protein
MLQAFKPIGLMGNLVIGFVEEEAHPFFCQGARGF